MRAISRRDCAVLWGADNVLEATMYPIRATIRDKAIDKKDKRAAIIRAAEKRTILFARRYSGCRGLLRPHRLKYQL